MCMIFSGRNNIFIIISGLFRTTRQAFRHRQGRQQEYDSAAAVAPSSSYGVDTTDDRLAGMIFVPIFGISTDLKFSCFF